MARPKVQGLTASETAVYAFRVQTDLLADWRAYTKKHGDSAQEALRAVMRKLLGRGPMATAPVSVEGQEPRPVTDQVDRAKKRRVELQLTESEHQVLIEIAESRECSVQYWIVSLIRAALTRGATVGAAELKQLGESNYQLMAIGRNLNQIAHQINADPRRNLHQLTLREIELLSKRIEEQRKHTQAVIEACSERWVIR